MADDKKKDDDVMCTGFDVAAFMASANAAAQVQPASLSQAELIERAKMTMVARAEENLAQAKLGQQIASVTITLCTDGRVATTWTNAQGNELLFGGALLKTALKLMGK